MGIETKLTQTSVNIWNLSRMQAGRMQIANLTTAAMIYLAAFALLWPSCVDCAPVSQPAQLSSAMMDLSTSQSCLHRADWNNETPDKELCSTEYWNQSETQQFVGPTPPKSLAQEAIASVSHSSTINALPIAPLNLWSPPPMPGSLFAQKTLLRV